jgi:hypothetical protein
VPTPLILATRSKPGTTSEEDVMKDIREVEVAHATIKQPRHEAEVAEAKRVKRAEERAAIISAWRAYCDCSPSRSRFMSGLTRFIA